MKNMIFRLVALLLVLCVFATALVACKNTDTTNTNTSGKDVYTEEPGEVYEFPREIVLEDKELSIFNFSEYYNAIIYTDTEEYSDNISTAVYDRNAYFFDKYGIDVYENQMVFTGREASFAESTALFTNLRAAGDDIYDIAYISINEQYTLLASGIMTDLTTISTLDLTSDWWDPQLSGSYVLSNGAQYVASSALNLMPYEMTWLVYFNQDMAEEKGIPNLFDYVRNGEWTIETMMRVITDYGVIQPDSVTGDYTFDASGTATYGVAVHNSTGAVMMQGFDITFIQKQDKEEQPYKFACSNSDAFASGSELLQTLCSRNTGMAIGSDYEADLVNHPEGYVPVFHSNRALFLNAELKSGMTLKKILNSEVYYGMLPLPKLDIEQKNYYTTPSASTMLLGIPTMNDEKEATGLAVDVLSYLSYRDLLPVYYDDYVTHRNASDKESMEMLNDYIMPGRRFDLGIIYGWTKTFTDTYSKIIYTQQAYNGSTLANIMTNHSKTVNEDIKKFFKS